MKTQQKIWNRISFVAVIALFGILFQPQIRAQEVKVEPLTINSSDDDFGATFSENGRVIFFTSARDGEKQRLYVSTGYSRPVELSKEVNDGEQVGAASVTPDGQFMVFSAYNHSVSGQGRTDLYSARKVNGAWTEVKNLGSNVNSSAWDSNPSLSADGMTLYFASDRDGGFGGTDIYVSKRVGDSWSKAENSGSSINSTLDEMNPSIAPDNATFYFASNRAGGLGGFDIYTAKVSGGKFTKIQNVGAPINSDGNEYFYSALANSNIAYFSSDRSGGTGTIDLYSAVPNPFPAAPVRIVQGVVKDAQTQAPLGATITITDMKTGTKVGQLASDDQTGQYYAMLPAGRDYAITATSEGYIFYSERFSVPASEKGKEVVHNIPLSPIKDGKTRLLVLFDYNKTELLEESTAELDRAVDFLKAHSAIKISVEGHTDDQGSDEFNDKLSKDRADAVKKYLVSQGITASRIKTKGNGKHHPAVEGTTDEARAQNRRVEMLIVE